MSEDRKNLKIFFSGLAPETLKEINGLSVINMIAGDEFFVSRGVDTVFIVLEGSLAVFSQPTDRTPVIVIPAGTCARQPLYEITAKSDGCRTALVMVINGKALEMMSANARYFIYRKIFEAESGIIAESIEKLKKADSRSGLIAAALKKNGLDAHRDLSGFEPVMRILGKIQKLPSAVSTLVGHIGSERTTARELADLVRTDPSMTASVLKIINSSYYSLEKKITDITYAIFYLGIDQILQIVVSHGLKSALSGNPEFQHLYLHSVIISQISGEIARLSGSGQPAVAGTTALLHDLGKNVAFILKEQNPRISGLIDLLAPSEMGRLLLESWNMPVFITDTVRYHMYPSFMDPYELPSDIRLSAVSLFIAHLVHDFIMNGSVNDDLMPYVHECLELLGWQEHCVRSLCEKILLPEFERKKSLYPEYFINFLDRLDIYICSGQSWNDDSF